MSAGVGLVYDPERARKGVEEVWDKLQALQKRVSDAHSDSKLTSADGDALIKEYASNFPVSYQINWALTKHSEADAQAVADAIRAQLQEIGGRTGNNRAVPRLFNAS